MTWNVVELCADELIQSPCVHGLIVDGHACYCHDDEWKDGPRKCPVWRNFGTPDLSKWHRREWELVELPMFKGISQDGQMISKNELRPCMPDDDKGGCPHFVLSLHKAKVQE